MSYILMSQFQIRALQDQLESVTNQTFRLRIVENSETNLLCAWQNETHVDYLLHVMAHRDRTFQIAFAVQKFRDIETRFDRRLDKIEAGRLFNDPRTCVRYLVGQLYATF